MKAQLITIIVSIAHTCYFKLVRRISSQKLLRMKIVQGEIALIIGWSYNPDLFNIIWDNGVINDFIFICYSQNLVLICQLNVTNTFIGFEMPFVFWPPQFWFVYQCSIIQFPLLFLERWKKIYTLTLFLLKWFHVSLPVDFAQCSRVNLFKNESILSSLFPRSFSPHLSCLITFLNQRLTPDEQTYTNELFTRK